MISEIPLDKSKKITIVQITVPLYRVAFFSGLESVLNRKGHQLRVCTGIEKRNYPKTVDGSFTWLDRSYTFLKYKNFEIPLQRSINCLQIDSNTILILYGDKNCILTTIFLMVKARWKKSTVVWWGQYYPQEKKKSIGFSIRKYLMKQADGILLYTFKEEEDARLTFDPNTYIGCTNNSVDTSYMCEYYTKNNKEKDWSTKGTADKPLVISFIGRFTRKSKVWLIPNLIASLKDDGINAMCKVIGGGKYEKLLLEEVKKYGVEKQILMEGEIYDESKITNILFSCDCMFYPGSVGLSLLHAMALGLPCLLKEGARNHNPEYCYVVPGQNSLFYNEKSTGTILKIENVQQILEGDMRKKMSHCAHSTAEKYSINNMITSTEEFLSKLIVNSSKKT
jgi:glycosyltransferase involved in cell wall biosynthesis